MKGCIRQFTRFPQVLALVAVIILVPVRPGFCQSTAANRAGMGDILHELAPDDAPPASLKLKPTEKARAIRLLLAAKREESGWHKQLAIYLLATLGQDYERNRDALLRAWAKVGDDGTMALVIQLYEQGHEELLQPLLARYDGWNAATSEGLGTFYGDLMAKNPQDFLAVLATFPPRRQLYLCTSAGEADGGGMNPKTERRVLSNLKAIGGEVADRCASGVRAGNRSANEANQEEQKGIQNEQKKK